MFQRRYPLSQTSIIFVSKYCFYCRGLAYTDLFSSLLISNNDRFLALRGVIDEGVGLHHFGAFRSLEWAWEGRVIKAKTTSEGI